MLCRRCVLTAALLLATIVSTAPAPAQQTHEAQGWFTVDGEKVEVRAAYGWQEPHLFDRTRKETLVVVSTVPLDYAALDAYMSIGFEINDMLRAKGGEALFIRIEPDGRVVSAMPTRIANAAGGASAPAADLKVSGTSIVGSAKSDQPILVTDLGDDPAAGVHTDRAVTYDVRFHITLADRSPRGSALPSGGGEPGAAYMALHKARMAWNREAIVAGLDEFRAAEFSERMNDPRADEMIASMKEHGPQTARVVGGTADGDYAWLDVEGALGGKGTYKAQVRMVRRDGRWLMAEERLEFVE